MGEHTRNPLAGRVRLRDIAASDLPTLFEQQLDPDANYMAAFTAKDPTDRDAFDAHWAKIMGDAAITLKTILFDGHIAGSILSHAWFGKPEISYWLGKEYWDKGVATEALSQFLAALKVRPLYARTVRDNVASLRVLAKCGFAISGEDNGFANARGTEVEEFILELK